MTLSELMVKYRAKHDVTMREASEKAGIALQTWMYVERNLQSPSRRTEQKIRLLVEEKE